MKLVSQIIGFALVGILAQANASDYPSYGHLSTTRSDMGFGTKFECEPANVGPTTRINCKFTQFFINPKAEMSPETEAAWEEEAKSILAMSAEDLKKQWADGTTPENCRRIDPTTMKDQMIAEGRWPYDEVAGERFLRIAQTFYDLGCTDKEIEPKDVIAAARLSYENDLKTCKVRTNTYERVFEKRSDTTWVSSDGPTGLCSTVSVGTFTQEKEAASLWNYKENRIVTTTDDEFCAALERDLTVEYSWRENLKAIKSECLFIEMDY